MDERTLELLELPAILEWLAALAESEPGKRRALGLTPSADPDEVAEWQELTAEAIAVIERSGEPDLAAARDVRPDTELASRGRVLDTHALGAIAATIGAGLAARAALDGAGAPRLELIAREPGVDLSLIHI